MRIYTIFTFLFTMFYWFLSVLNSRHMNINFTIENESNGSLAFLDVKISRFNSNNTSIINQSK